MTEDRLQRASEAEDLANRLEAHLHAAEAEESNDSSFSNDKMSRSTSQASLSSTRYASALASPSAIASDRPTNPVLLLSAGSSETSSNSSFSRQSSVRSTDSVQAIPLRTPLRSPIHSPISFSRRESATINYPPGSANSHVRSSTETTVGLEHGKSFFPPVTTTNHRESVSSVGTYTNSNGEGLPATSRPWSLPLNGQAPSPHTRFAPLPSPSPALSQTENSMHIPLPSTSTFAILNSARSLPPTPAGLASTSLLRPSRPGMLSRSPSAMSLGVVVRRSTGDFTFGEKLGEGSYSSVYHVTDKQPPHHKYALKILDKRHIVKHKKQKYVNIEKDTLNKLDRHPGIIRLYWTFHDERSLYFVLELATNGEILKYIKSYGSFSTACARYYAAQILSAVEHMHSRGVIHRDLKPEKYICFPLKEMAYNLSILLDHNMRVKITDFGTAKLLEQREGDETVDDRANSFVGTAEYVSPELLSSKTAFRSSDFWALGCVVYQMIAGRPPFKAANEYLTFQKILALEYTFPENFPDDAKDLIRKLLILDPQARLGSTETGGVQAIKSHPFFSTIDFATLWTIDAPEIVCGIFEAPPAVKTTTADMLDYFGLVQEPVVDWRPTPSLAQEQPPSTLPIDVAAAKQDKALQQDADKWSACLLSQEMILYTGPVVDKSTIIKKKRQLVLTDFPRLLCLQENKSVVKIKFEVILGAASPKDGQENASESSIEVLKTVSEESPKQFKILTSAKVHRFEDLEGKASRWVRAIQQAHAPKAVETGAAE